MIAADEHLYIAMAFCGNPRVQVVRDDVEAKAIRVIDGETPEKLPASPLLIFTPGRIVTFGSWAMRSPIRWSAAFRKLRR